MREQLPPILIFKPKLFERLWGGDKLAIVCGIPHSGDTPAGEAWLVADHPQHVSEIDGGPDDGRTLRELVSQYSGEVLGHRAELTIYGRFPLLFKLLDAADHLSVQVHPDDEAATRLNEPDVGKTEMWHVLNASNDGELICGLLPGTNQNNFAAAIKEGFVEQSLSRFSAGPGTTVFVPAGTVHAIGKDILLSEIQQNSDITYRVYDWDRLQADGQPRELHVKKALDVIKFDEQRCAPSSVLHIEHPQYRQTFLGACQYFAAERLHVDGEYTRETQGDSFHILLGISGALEVHCGKSAQALESGRALMIPGEQTAYSLEGKGEFLCYYVPDLHRDILEPLRAAGHNDASIAALGDVRAK